jgi:hypothetical protein
MSHGFSRLLCACNADRMILYQNLSFFTIIFLKKNKKIFHFLDAAPKNPLKTAVPAFFKLHRNASDFLKIHGGL